MRRGCTDRYMFQPNFIEVQRRLKCVFKEPFEVVQFHLSNDAVPDCFVRDILALLKKFEDLHQRKIKRLHMGGEFGKGFLKVDFTIERGTPHSDGKPDHGRHRVIIITNLSRSKRRTMSSDESLKL